MTERESDLLLERSLATLSDTVYLNLMRNYLGAIPTPFNKPQLNRRLMTLFSSEPFVNRLCALITRWDASILTAAWLYVESTQDELCALFVDDLPYLDIQQNIVNLEERLLLMPCPTGSSVRKTLMVNPLLVKRLQQNGVFSLRLLTGESTIDPLDIKFSVPFDRRLLRAMFSLHLHQNVPVAEKGLRWLRSPAVIAIFSAWSVETATMYVPLIERMLQRLGVVRELGRETALDIPATRWLLAMGQHDLRVLFLCELSRELLLFGHVPETNAALAAFFSDSCAMAATSKAIGSSSLRKILHICAVRHGLQIQRYRELAALLCDTGTFSRPSGDEGLMVTALLMGKTGEKSAPFTIDSDFTVTFSSEPVASDGTDIIHLMCTVEKVDTVSTYRLTKESFRRALDCGCTLADIVAFLEEMGGRPLSSGLLNLLRHWNDESDSVRIYDGITVCADERIARLIEAIPSLERHRLATIAPGCYLFSRKTEPVWRQVLAEASSVILPQSISEETKNSNPESQAMFTVPVETDLTDRLATFAKLMEVPVFTEQGEPGFLDELRKKIASVKASKYDQEELMARLAKRLILVTTQIVPPVARSGPMSASGFDVQGKLNLIRSAIASPNEILELHVVDEELSIKKLMVEANELIGSNRDYTLRVTVLPEREEKVIAAEKIFLVRRLRRSVFFQ
jgi:hypothetical protein